MDDSPTLEEVTKTLEGYRKEGFHAYLRELIEHGITTGRDPIPFDNPWLKATIQVNKLLKENEVLINDVFYSFNSGPPTREQLEAIGKQFGIATQATRFPRRPDWMDEVERRCGILTVKRR